MRALAAMLLACAALAPAARAAQIADVPFDRFAGGPVLAPGGAAWAEGDGGSPIDLRLWHDGTTRTFFTIDGPGTSPDPSSTRTQTVQVGAHGGTMAVERELYEQPNPPVCEGPYPCIAPPMPAPFPFRVDFFAGRIGEPLVHVATVGGPPGCLDYQLPLSVSRSEVAWVVPACSAIHRRCRVMSARIGRRPRILVPGCADAVSIAGRWVAWTTDRVDAGISKVRLLNRRTKRRVVLHVLGAGGPDVAPNGQVAVSGSICHHGRCSRLGETIVMTQPGGRRPHNLPGSEFSELIGFARGRVLATSRAGTPGKRCADPGNALVGGWRGLAPIRSGGHCVAAEYGHWDGRRIAYARGDTHRVQLFVRRFG